jgi:anti-sigma factor RsiW
MRLDCDEAQRWIDPWVDGELDPSAAMSVDAHVARCPLCKAEVEATRAVKRSLAGLREACAPTALRHRVLAALDAEEDQRAQEETQRRRKAHARNVALTGAALAGVVLAAGHRFAPNRDGAADPTLSAGMVPMLEDVAQRHARELPCEVQASDPATVSAWFRGKMDIPVQPMTFQGQPARLVGARISNIHDRVAAALYYDVSGRRMTVFVFDGTRVSPGGMAREVVGGRSFYVGSTRGYTVTFTQRRGVGYAVASDLPPQDTVRLLAASDLR